MGFVTTASDLYILAKVTNIIILYVDDCIIMARTKEEADTLLSELKTKGYKWMDESTMEEYIGILITYHANGSYRMPQPHLVDRIIDSILEISNACSAKSPA